MKRIEYSYLSADGNTPIYGVLWEPASTPKAILQISHGITEHMGRYEEMAERFTALGYAVAGNDNLGHGRSLSKTNPLPMYFGPQNGWNHVVQDALTCGRLLKVRYPGVPLCFVGLSLGSFVVRTVMGQYPEFADMAIVAGTGQLSRAEYWLANTLLKLERLRYGDTVATPLVQYLTVGSYNKHFSPNRTNSDWLCADAQAVDAYLADPLVGDGFTVGSFRDLLCGMKLSADGKIVANIKKNLPILLISGEKDPVGDFGKNVEKVRSAYRAAGCADVTVCMFPGMRHDVFRDTGYLSVYECMADWIEKRL